MSVFSLKSVPGSGYPYRVREDCRLCAHRGMEKVLELAPTPPANELLGTAEESVAQDRFPLWLARCRRCGHVQLPVVVDPARLFGDYRYVSGTSPVFVDHLRRYAATLAARFGAQRLVLEIGSNDGTFLRNFVDAGVRTIGVDPAAAIAGAATLSGVRTLPRFFDLGVAEAVSHDLGRATLVVANNVLAHTDDIEGMVRAVMEVLDRDGTFVFEVQYLVDPCRGAMFDMVYHEHVSYHHVHPLQQMLDRLGMRLFDAERVPVHGGSIRCYADFGRNEPTGRLDALLDAELESGWGLSDSAPRELSELGQKVERVRAQFQSFFQETSREGETVAGYGAPAKACTLLHHFGLGAGSLKYAVDDNPRKRGLHLPGNGVPIAGPDALGSDPPDFLLMLAWNYADDIMRNPACRAFKARGGRFLVPFPELRVE